MTMTHTWSHVHADDGKTWVHLTGTGCNVPVLRSPEQPEPETFTEAEQLGLLVGAALGKAMAERDQAIYLLRELTKALPHTSWAHANAAEEAAKAWLNEYDAARTVGSPETPDEETTGP